MEDPELGPRADVAALPINQTQGILVLSYPVEDTDPMKWDVADPVFIIGFPFGRTAGSNFAVWVRGSTASEPEIDFDELPMFLVDARTRRGQSGSPVILHASGKGVVHTEGGSLSVGTGQSTGRLLGVYSGRTSEGSDLGRVWRTEVVQRIIEAGVAGTP
ncbi:serine protease [Egibacter rhizosphaerae]|uniref:serine protease n=1 Tax=Egibacter rhizosphaerae TaxID=1670831 RepID=UPI001F117CFC|nr:serine protease [Egibacter rhizosphaerae]